MNPRSGLVGLVAVATLVFAGCGGGTSAPSGAKTYNLWYVNPLPNTPDWGRSSKLFQQGASAGGYKATLTGPDKIDTPAMVSQIEQAITSKADGILTCPLDPSAFKAVISKAQAQGIIVGSIGCVDDDANFSIGTDNTAYGQVAADFIAAHTGGNAKVGIVGTDQTTPNQVKQVQGFKARLAEKYPNIQLLTWESDNSDAGVAATKIGAMVKAYPQMNFLWIIEGAAPGAVPAAFKEAGLTPGKVLVLAVDAQASTLKAIDDGWITATLNQCWFDASPQAAKRMIQAKQGQSQPKFIPIKVDPVTKDRLPYQGCPAEYSTY